MRGNVVPTFFISQPEVSSPSHSLPETELYSHSLTSAEAGGSQYLLLGKSSEKLKIIRKQFLKQILNMVYNAPISEFAILHLILLNKRVPRLSDFNGMFMFMLKKN
jgi:hypothetical protein